MDKDRVARLHLKSPAQQILRGEAFQQHRRRGLVGKTFRQLDQTILGDDPLLGIGAKARRIGDPVADLEVFDALAELDHFAGGLIAGRERSGDRIVAVAEINVDEIDADRMIADENFAAPRRRQFDVLDPHHLGSANLANPDGFCHGS